MNDALSLKQALGLIFTNPGGMLLRRWNWKSSLLSSLVRGGIFFSANLGAGLGAATSAMLAEFALRAVTSGFCGALTQAFRRVQPAWKGMVAVLLLLPVANHALEFTLHWFRGTPALLVSIAVSVSFTVVSTSFNYFAMRRGLLTVGQGSQGLLYDLAQMPLLIWRYFGAIGGFFVRLFQPRLAGVPGRVDQRRCCEQNEG